MGHGDPVLAHRKCDARPPTRAVGALVRRSGPVGTVAVLLVPAGSALQMLLLPPPPESAMAWPVRLSVWVTAAVVTVLIARRTLNSRDPSLTTSL